MRADPPSPPPDEIQEALQLATLIMKAKAEDISMLVLTIRGTRAGVDPRLLRAMARLLLAYANSSMRLRDAVDAMDAKPTARQTYGQREDLESDVLEAARNLVGPTSTTGGRE